MWDHNDLQILKVSFLEEKLEVWIFSILVATFVALSGQWSDMQGFYLDYIFLYLDKCV